MAESVFVWLGPTPVFPSPLGPASGGTGISSYTIGDLLYASASTTLSKLADVAAGSVLASGGVGVAPAWSSTPLVTSVTLGASTRNKITSTADGNLRTTNNAGSLTYDVTLDAAKIVTVGGGVSVLNNATLDLGNLSGLLVADIPADNRTALFMLTSISTEISDPNSVFSTNKDTASSTNIYFETDRFFLQNLRGSTKVYSLQLFR